MPVLSGMPSTSSWETSPLLGTDSTRTLINASTSGHSDFSDRGIGQAYRKWVPDPSSKEEENRARTIIICFDGTGDQYDDDNSNVVQFVTCLKKDNQGKQLVYYQPGVGTYTESVFFTPLVSQASMVLDSMVAWNLSKHVTGGYEYLMQNYSEGDKISIFGFSRGAYTARALAGMIQKVGLLPPFNHAQIPFAWDMYTREDDDGLRASIGFKKAFCTDVPIDFIGVWDTVASVGLFDKELPFVGTNSAIRVFRHAIALDEHRAKFMPNFYHLTEDAEPDANAAQHQLELQQRLLSVKRQKSQDDKSLEWQAKINEASGFKTDGLEVWFAGCHCDVGGGSVQNGTRNTLARIPLRWMIRQCFATKTGIIFDGDMLKNIIGIDPDMLYPEVIPRPPRLLPTADLEIANRVRQPSPVWLFIKALGQLLLLPITTFFRLLYKPIHHFWLLVEYTTVGKFVRKHLGIQPHNCGQRLKLIHNEDMDRTPFVSEEEEELADALSPEYDQLSLAWFWWILEGIPFRFREQKGVRDDFFVRANWGNGRKIYGDAIKNGLKIHRSVKTRLEITDAEGRSVYRPRAWFDQKVSANGFAKKTGLSWLLSWFTRKTGIELTQEGPERWNIDEPNLWKWVD